MNHLGRRSALRVTLTPRERSVLRAWQRQQTIPAGVARRGRLILLVAEGLPLAHVARRVGISRRFVYKWIGRFQAQGVDGLLDLPRGEPWRTRWPKEERPCP
jgi:hypothetical protein